MEANIIVNLSEQPDYDISQLDIADPKVLVSGDSS